MITGSLKSAGFSFEAFPEPIRKALEYLKNTDLAAMEDGRYLIDGEKNAANLQRYTTRIPESGKPEAHRKYIDIQYIVEGAEEIGYCPLSDRLVEHTPYDADKDLIFYEDLVPASHIVVEAGDYAILYPNDVHRPCGALDGEQKPVTKVVVKIAVDIL